MEIERLKLFIRENIRLLLGLTVVIFFVILIISLLLNRSQNTEVLVNEQTFDVTVAKSETEKQIGLSETEVLGVNEGMLFVFDRPDFYSFWMNNMKFPIDIIFVNGNRVTTVISNAPAPTNPNESLQIYKPGSESDKVLEINAGLAKKYGIKEGTIIDIDNL